MSSIETITNIIQRLEANQPVFIGDMYDAMFDVYELLQAGNLPAETRRRLSRGCKLINQSINRWALLDEPEQEQINIRRH